MKTLYGNFDQTKGESTFVMKEAGPEGAFFPKGATVKVQPYFVQSAEDSGTIKVFFLTQGIPAQDEPFDCHACAPLIGAAVFAKKDGAWTVEARDLDSTIAGGWGRPPEARLLRIGPRKKGVELKVGGGGQGVTVVGVSILVPWNGSVSEALVQVISDDNGGYCGNEEGMMPCYSTHTSIGFVKGENTEYDDVIVKTAGTRLSKSAPYKAEKVDETERRVLRNGKYALPLH